MDGGGPFEVARVAPRRRHRIVVGNVKSGFLRHRPAVLRVIALEREQHELYARPHPVEQVQHAIDIAWIHAPRRIARAAGIEIEQALGELLRIRDREHLRVEPDAAAGIAVADEVGVAVPDAGRIHAFPCGEHGVVAGEFARQRGAARIDDTVLGPEAPGGERRQRGRSARGGKQAASFAHGL